MQADEAVSMSEEFPRHHVYDRDQVVVEEDREPIGRGACGVVKRVLVADGRLEACAKVCYCQYTVIVRLLGRLTAGVASGGAPLRFSSFLHSESSELNYLL